MRNAFLWGVGLVLSTAVVSLLTTVVTLGSPHRAAPGNAPAPALSLETEGSEGLAVRLLQLASANDREGSRAIISPSLGQAELTARVTAFEPRPLHAAPLPRPTDDEERILIWAEYTAAGQPTIGLYQVTVSSDQVTAVSGPLSPLGGYRPLILEPLDQHAKRVPSHTYQGRPLILLAPRAPEPLLARTLIDLHELLAPRGITVALVIDMHAPDWAGTARAAGFTGPIWRWKGNVESIPTVTPGRLQGAAGLLIDREGIPVASVAALDPFRYGLPDQTPAQIAEAVLRAYGLHG